MLSTQIKNSGSLLDSIDAVRNWRAVVLLLATLVCMALTIGLGGLLAQVSFFFTALFVLAAYGLFFYGANAVGMMMMDEARGEKSRPPLAAVTTSLATSHRLILVFLLLGALYLAGFLVLAIVLFICKVPFLGPVLYTVVFPVSVVVVGMALFAVPTVIFPLSAPAIWGGAGTMECISQLLAIARKRLVMVLLLMVAVSFIATVVGFLIGAILFTGTATTALLSAPILGGMPGVIPGMGSMGMAGMAMGGMGGMGIGGHAVAAALGGGLLFAVAFTLPGMVYLRGASTVYLRAIDGLDLASEQAAMDGTIAAARSKARDLQAQAQAVAQKYATPAPAPVDTATSAPAPVNVAAPAPTAAASAAAPAAAPTVTPAWAVPPGSTASAPVPAAAPVVLPPDVPPASTPGTDVPASPPSSSSASPSAVGAAAIPATISALTSALTSAVTPATLPSAAPAPSANLALCCPQCLAPVQTGDAFCGECGHKLR